MLVLMAGGRGRGSRDKMDGMPRFSIKDLLISTTLVALGCSAILLCVNPPQWWWGNDKFMYLYVLIFFSVGACFGSAVGRFFKRPYMGGLVGAWLQLIISIVCVVLFT